MQNKKKTAMLNELADKASVIIAKHICLIQGWFGRTMNQLTRGCSARLWKLLIVLFAISWGLATTYFIKSAFGRKVIKYPVHLYFIAKPVSDDSLLLMERIYQNRKK